MDLRQLNYFITIVEEKQITKAAKKLHMAQPPLSNQLKVMEEELNCKLFDRNGRTLELTEPGKILYEKGKTLLANFEDTISEIKEVGEGLRGVLSIGADQTCLSYLPEKIKRMRERYPNLNFKIIEGDTFFLTNSLLNKEIDLAILQQPIEDENFSSIGLALKEFVLATPAQWHLPNPIQMEDLKDLPFLSFYRHRSCSTFRIIIDEFKSHGFEPNIICECIDIAMVISLISEGLGITILPKTSLDKFLIKGINIIKFANCNIHSKANIVWPKDRYLAKHTMNFLQLFKEETHILARETIRQSQGV
ncbi:LysR family transcriptional regulator [Lysinibacillus xylanilyticus]|uniref:LysR family transcriptional regulator n=1 Tax=Lysinibacillus xylanilyticus TaxID=582475 RepID=UPI00083C977F|nr:LysR family transcriptional regulator [Lysinibacillus xylanilyticus]